MTPHAAYSDIIPRNPAEQSQIDVITRLCFGLLVILVVIVSFLIYRVAQVDHDQKTLLAQTRTNQEIAYKRLAADCNTQAILVGADRLLAACLDPNALQYYDPTKTSPSLGSIEASDAKRIVCDLAIAMGFPDPKCA